MTLRACGRVDDHTVLEVNIEENSDEVKSILGVQKGWDVPSSCF